MVGGKQYSSSFSITKITRFPILLIIISITCFSLIYYIFSISNPNKPIFTPNLNPKVQYSFVDSLEQFLQKPVVTAHRDDTVGGDSETEVKKLDDLIWKSEISRVYDSEWNSPVRVYVYEMPNKFTYDMLWLFHNTFKETRNLTSNGSPVHRLIEQVRFYIYRISIFCN